MESPLPFADVALPPTFVLDSLYLGWPVGPVVMVVLLASAVTAFFWLRKRRVPRWAAVLACLLVYVVVNFGIFLYAGAKADERKREYRQKILSERSRKNRGAKEPSTEKPPKGSDGEEEPERTPGDPDGR
jgi:hypothetical protein